MAGGAVAGWEAFTGDDEGGSIWPKVEEELSEDKESEKTTGAKLVVGEAKHTEDDCENDETTNLNWLTSNGVAEGDSNPVTRNGSCANNDQVTDSGVVKNFVNVSVSS